MPTLVIDQKPFHFENLDDSLTSTIIDALSRNLVTPSQVYDILKIIDTKSNYIYIEQLLQETRKINQFTNNKDTYYLLALYIEITIAKLYNYTNNINEIFKTNDFKPLLGYYFIYQKKDTHNLLKNDPVSLLGKKVLKPESDLLAWINGDESLYTKIKEKYPRAAVFDKQFACMESEIMNIMVDNATDEYIEELVTLANTYNSESFRSDVNFYIGQIYHKRKDYLNASKYYSKSCNENAIYNLMRITREIKDENEKYSKITNYIKLINGRTDFIEPLSSVCSLRLSERWCGNALLAYYKADGISDELRTINLSYFYYKCMEDNEIEIINQFYELIKDKEFEKHDTSVIFGIDTPEVRFCTGYIVDELYKLGTDLAKYNLSFFVAKQSAVEVLNTIVTKNENVLSQLAVLTNCLDTIKEIIPLNKLLSQMLMSNYYFRTNNLSHAKDILMNMNDDYADSQLAYIQYQQYRKNYNEEFLGRMLKYLKNYQNIYVVYLVAVYLYEKRFVKKCCNLLKQMIIELEKERNVHKRNLLNNCYTLMAFCHLYNKEYREGMEYLDKSKNKDLMIKVSSILSNK